MSFPLEKCDGPGCPRCGCEDTEILREAETDRMHWWGSGQARCNFCGRIFNFKLRLQDEPPDWWEPEPKVEGNGSEPPKPTSYPVGQCPECGSPAISVVSSPKPKRTDSPRVRYHRCKDCKLSFKSIDSRYIGRN